jgi:hypothetical protein
MQKEWNWKINKKINKNPILNDELEKKNKKKLIDKKVQGNEDLYRIFHEIIKSL